MDCPWARVDADEERGCENFGRWHLSSSAINLGVRSISRESSLAVCWRIILFLLTSRHLYRWSFQIQEQMQEIYRSQYSSVQSIKSPPFTSLHPHSQAIFLTSSSSSASFSCDNVHFASAGLCPVSRFLKGSPIHLPLLSLKTQPKILDRRFRYAPSLNYSLYFQSSLCPP